MDEELPAKLVALYIAVGVAMWAETYRRGHGWRALLYGAFWPVSVVVILYWTAYFLLGGE